MPYYATGFLVQWIDGCQDSSLELTTVKLGKTAMSLQKMPEMMRASAAQPSPHKATHTSTSAASVD